MAEILERYLSEPNLKRVDSDMRFLLKAVNKSFGELELAFRAGRLSVYYRGNSLATIVFRPHGLYWVDIHDRFFHGAGLDPGLITSHFRSYSRVEVDQRGLHALLQQRNVGRLMRAVREVNHSEELTFEQILIADNPPSPGFLIIDRQVQDRHMQRRLDLLGLRRSESGKYRFVVVEVKLGKNAELSEEVATQLHAYTEHIRQEAIAYQRCYTKTYEQRRRLGLIPATMPASIEIDGSQVEGLVAVGGYSQQAAAQAALLTTSHPELKVLIFRNRMFDESGTLTPHAQLLGSA